jgi:hypothetical protein
MFAAAHVEGALAITTLLGVVSAAADKIPVSAPLALLFFVGARAPTWASWSIGSKMSANTTNDLAWKENAVERRDAAALE